MKKHIITGILIVACAVLGSVVWPRSAEDGKIPAELVKPAVIAETEANPEETLPIFLSDDTYVPEPKGAIESKPAETEVNTTEDKIRTTPAIPTKSEVSTNPSSAPKAGTLSVINGERYIWVPSFGWVKDEGGGSIAIPVDGEGDINKQIGVMGGGSTVGNPGDELTGHKVGIMGGGIVAEDMYESGVKIGIVGGEETPIEKMASPCAELPEPTGDVIYIELQPPVTKDSTPQDYKPGQ